jgi:hypothetical protein
MKRKKSGEKNKIKFGIRKREEEERGVEEHDRKSR